MDLGELLAASPASMPDCEPGEYNTTLFEETHREITDVTQKREPAIVAL